MLKELIKHIRSMINMTQEQFAKEIGVSSVIVDQWECGKKYPSPTAQEQLYEICKRNDIVLLDCIISKIKKEGALYHASRKGIEGKIQPTSRSKCDFGRGFYMGTDPLQPLTLVCNEEKPMFYTLEFNVQELKCLDMEIGIDWAMMIAYFRGYLEEYTESSLYQKYAHMADDFDVIIGYIANDRMYQVLTDFFEGRITDTALLGSLSALKLGRQYVAISQKACNQITIKSEYSLSELELMVLKDKSIIRRKEGVSLANQIVRQHRRDGRFFDEILKGVEG